MLQRKKNSESLGENLLHPKLTKGSPETLPSTAGHLAVERQELQFELNIDTYSELKHYDSTISCFISFIIDFHCSNP